MTTYCYNCKIKVPVGVLERLFTKKEEQPTLFESGWVCARCFKKWKEEI